MENRVRELELVGEGWLVNGKYLIDHQGTIWYDHNYLGYRKDFPLWLFKLRDELCGK